MKLAIMLLFTATAFAQKEELTTTEKIAIQAVQQQAQKALEAIAEDIKRAHPGYQLDPKTMTLVPIQKPAEVKK